MSSKLESRIAFTGLRLVERAGGEGISFLGKSRGRVICGRVLSQRTRNKRTSLADVDKVPDSIGRARNFEANVSWVGEIQEQC